MDKIARALIGLSDVTARVDAAERKKCAVIAGTQVSGGVSFGRVEGIDVAVIVTFTGSGTLEYNGAAAGGGSPLLAVISGKGELRLDGEVSNARALVMGAKKIEKEVDNG